MTAPLGRRNSSAPAQTSAQPPTAPTAPTAPTGRRAEAPHLPRWGVVMHLLSHAFAQTHGTDQPYRVVMGGLHNPDHALLDRVLSVNGVPHEILVYPTTSTGEPGFDFPRNLAGHLPDEKTVVMSDGEVMSHLNPGLPVVQAMAESNWFLKQKLQNAGVPVRTVPLPLNFANVAYDKRLDLLIVAHGVRPKSVPCDKSLHPAVGCQKQADEVVEIYGRPANVLQFEESRKAKTCLEQDMYLSPVFRNELGKPFMLVYPPCVAERPSSKAAADAGVVGREKALARLEGLGIEVIRITESQFNRKVTNLICPQDGVVVLSGPDPELAALLESKGCKVAHGVEFGKGRRDYGAHCETFELPPETPEVPAKSLKKTTPRILKPDL